MRFTALASVLLFGTLAAGCVDQRSYAYPGSYCDEYGCGAPVAPVVQAPAYWGGGPGYAAGRMAGRLRRSATIPRPAANVRAVRFERPSFDGAPDGSEQGRPPTLASGAGDWLPAMVGQASAFVARRLEGADVAQR